MQTTFRKAAVQCFIRVPPIDTGPVSVVICSSTRDMLGEAEQQCACICGALDRQRRRHRQLCMISQHRVLEEIRWWMPQRASAYHMCAALI